MKDDEFNEVEEDGNYQNNLPLNKNPLRNTNKKIPERLQQLSRMQNVKQENKKYRMNKSKEASSNDNSSNNLKQKIANNKEKNRGLFSRFKKGNKNQEDNNETNSSSTNQGESSDQNEENSGVDEVVSKARKIKKIFRIVSISLPILFLIIPITLIFSVLLSFVGVPAASSETYGTKEYQSLSKIGTVAYQNEQNYQKKLKQVAAVYKEKCKEELNVNYIHAALIYYYYTVEIPNNYDDNSDDTLIVDFTRMTSMVDTIASLMYSSNSCFVDYSKGGDFYNKLKGNTAFRNYYSNLLKTENIDKILDDIFSLAEVINIKDELEELENVFIPENTKITIDSSSVGGSGSSSGGNSSGGSSSSGNGGGSSSGSQGGNSSGGSSGSGGGSSSGSQGGSSSGGSSGSNSSKTNVTSISFKEYLLGVLYANNTSDDLLKGERVKALIIAYTSNILADNSLSINTQTISFSNIKNELSYCNPDDGCSYIVKNNQKSLQVGGSDGGNGNNIFYAGKYYYRSPMDSFLKTTLLKLIDEIYGYVLVDSEDKFALVDVSKINNIEVTNYKDILSKAYSNLTLKNIRENTYDSGVNYGNTKVSTSVIAYDQNDYDDVIFCGRTNPKATIKTSGCGITAMAIIVSSYEKSKKYDPVAMMNDAYKWGHCGYGVSGTAIAFFQKEAKNMGYKYLKVGKTSISDKNLVLSHLREGNLIIAHMGPGKFTSGGHYIVLSGIDPDTKKVYVVDPYNKRNKVNGRNSGNGWYSFNDIIVKEAKAFYIIWKG